MYKIPDGRVWGTILGGVVDLGIGTFLIFHQE